MLATPIADAPEPVEGEPRVFASVPMGPSGELVECVLTDLTDDELHAITRGWDNGLSLGPNPDNPRLLLEKSLERRAQHTQHTRGFPDEERLSAELHHLAIQAGLEGRDAEMDTLAQAADYIPQLWGAGYRAGRAAQPDQP